MRNPPIPFVVAALLFLLPGAASAQDAPEAVFGKFHRAMLAGNIDDMNKYGTPGGATEIAKLPADKRKQVLDALKAVTPKNYKITGRQLSKDGNHLTLRMTGTGAAGVLGMKADPQDGVILMVKQGGEWKVDDVKWQDAKGRSAPAAAATPSAPEVKPGIAPSPCVIYPVMTKEEMDRCR